MANAVYVHIPYCKSKCPYCDFASVPVDESAEAYVHALMDEIRCRAGEASVVDTIYVGGGTPTVLQPDSISRLLACLRNSFRLSPAAEVTVEANPCSTLPAAVEALAAAGVNRVSLGAQSFVDAELESLGRAHTSSEIYSAVASIRQAGVANVNLDLIFGIPGQTAASWRDTLAEAVSLSPEHVSTYCLTYEPGTPYRRLLDSGTIRKSPDEEELAFSETAHETLTAAGYEHYEISNFAVPGRRSAHNTVYWRNEEYIGLGASAVSYIDGRRIGNVRDPRAYIRAMETTGTAIGEVDEIPNHMRAIETMIQRLRLSEWIDCLSFSSRYGFDPASLFNGALDGLIQAGLIERSADSIRSTLKGWRLANEVALKLLP